MCRLIARALLLFVTVVGLGCSKNPNASVQPIAQKSQIPDLIKRLKDAQAPLARRAVVNQIASLGTEANTPEVLKALEDARKKVTGNERKYVDEAIAKVKGTAPPGGNGRK